MMLLWILAALHAMSFTCLHAALIAQARRNWVLAESNVFADAADFGVLRRAYDQTRANAKSLQPRVKQTATTRVTEPRVHIDCPGLPKSVTWSGWKAMQHVFNDIHVTYELRMEGKKFDDNQVRSQSPDALIRLYVYGLRGGMQAPQQLDRDSLGAMSHEALLSLAVERGLTKKKNKQRKTKPYLIDELLATASVASSSSSAAQAQLPAPLPIQNDDEDRADQLPAESLVPVPATDKKEQKRLRERARYQEHGGREKRYKNYHEDGGKEKHQKWYHETGGKEAKRKWYHEDGGKELCSSQYEYTKTPQPCSTPSRRSSFYCGDVDQAKVWTDTAVQFQATTAFPYTLPPCFASLADESCLACVREFHDFLASPTFITCTHCWRAWYHVVARGDFAATCDTNKDQWFEPDKSTILTIWHFKAEIDTSIAAQLPDDIACNVVECACGARGSAAGYEAACRACGQARWLRHVATCSDCSGSEFLRRDFAVDPLYEIREDNRYRAICTIEEHNAEIIPPAHGQPALLGRTIQAIAPALSALTDFEEMVISLVHPLVQVYTIPRTGELAYVGHVCNFRQNVCQFMSKIPVLPKNMPTIFVRPRQSAANPDRMVRKPFAVNMDRLRVAFAWLKEHNHYYQAIIWDEDAAAAWNDNPELPSREEDIESHGDVDHALFCKWIAAGQTARDSGSPSFALAQKLFALLPCTEAGDGADTDLGKLWFKFLDELAELRDKKVLRVAQVVVFLASIVLHREGNVTLPLR